MNASPRTFICPAKTLDGPRPQHAEGSKLGDLEEVVCANRKGKLNRGGSAIDVPTARLHLRENVDSSGKGESNFFSRGSSGLLKLRAVNRKGQKPGRMSPNNFSCEVKVRERIPSGRYRRSEEHTSELQSL